MNIKSFGDRLLTWFDKSGRKDLPWQQQTTPYHVWLSEIMLQQTQVNTVIPYYLRFIDRFPDIVSLANASVDDVLALWTGLGYYARARNLHKTAGIITQSYNGKMPANIDTLLSLPGIGRSTAGAIMSLAHHQRFPILDGNVKRVLSRYAAIEGWPGNKIVEKELWHFAEQLLPEHRYADYIQAQMDLGATLCTRSKPNCTACPFISDCQAYLQGTPTHYPTPKPKKVLPSRQTHWIVVQSVDGALLLEQRDNHGIWGGLWSFPEKETIEDVNNYCVLAGRFVSHSLEALTPIKHSFSHYTLTIYPHLIQCKQNINNVADNNKLKWYKIDDALQLGLPAPVKQFIQSL
ncbi:MAG: A/G-specific adenine glycosylase [Gammaproteobacteria bacterium]|nr:A/G-specific adenine glycosylase [Gammaproteobacteria bacterium]